MTRNLPMIAAVLGLVATPLAAGEKMVLGPGPAGRVNAANKAGFATAQECKAALAAEITRQRDNPGERPEKARAAPADQFAKNQLQHVDCRAAEGGSVFHAVWIEGKKPAK